MISLKGITKKNVSSEDTKVTILVSFPEGKIGVMLISIGEPTLNYTN